MKRALWLATVVLLAAASAFYMRANARLLAAGSSVLEVKTLSADASRVSGGDVLVQITVPSDAPTQNIAVTAGGRDQSNAFHKTTSNVFMGLVTGLALGRNTLTVSAGGRNSTLEITNYPITGPVTSGPWIQPFICQTDVFKLPDGTTLGPPIDANCSAKTVVQYIYRTTGAEPTFKPLSMPASAANLPADLAKTTTTSGVTMNFIVRVETGTMNRGIYQNVVLFDPTSDAPPTPFSPPKGWNRRLIAMHGSGCPGGWYIQGPQLGANIIDPVRLGEGYALFNNTLNHPTNSCNAVVAGETAVMGKEHFIETFGVPFYTFTTGGSGGAYTSLQIADAFPGLFDGVTISATFPDALAIAASGLDGRLLAHYFTVIDPSGFTESQKVTVSGYHGMKAFIDAANQSQRTDPVPNRVDIEGYQSARWNPNAKVPEQLRYDPVTNPKGARPTVFDVAGNVYGGNPSTGAALRPFDNVGVQYGLEALNRGAISVKQFLELNQKIGGYDQDANYTAARAVGDAGAIKRAYQSGLMLGANGGLTSIPIFDNATSNETGGYHYGWFHFALRERLRQAAGNSDTMVMWRAVNAAAAKDTFDTWMVAYKSDTSNEPQRTKVIRAKPKLAADGCFDKSTPPVFVPDALPFSSKPVSKCSELYPVYSNPRHEAGGPLAANVLKCQMKPIDARDYQVTLSDAERKRLNEIFPTGVCDWSKPGVNQTAVVPWASFGPSPKNLVFDVTKQ